MYNTSAKIIFNTCTHTLWVLVFVRFPSFHVFSCIQLKIRWRCVMRNEYIYIFLVKKNTRCIWYLKANRQHWNVISSQYWECVSQFSWNITFGWCVSIDQFDFHVRPSCDFVIISLKNARACDISHVYRYIAREYRQMRLFWWQQRAQSKQPRFSSILWFVWLHTPPQTFTSNS